MKTQLGGRFLWVEIVLAGLLVALLSFYALELANPQLYAPGRDGGFFMYVGQQLARGSTLYTQLWDSKGPLIFWINALGMGASGNRWGLFLLEFGFMAIWLGLAYYILRRQFGVYAAILGTICGAFCFKLAIGLGNFTEEYSLLFTWLSLGAFAWLLVRPKCRFWPFVLIAASMVLSFLLRANNTGTQAAVVLAALSIAIKRDGFKPLGKAFAGLLTGALLVFLPVIVALALRGNLRAMWEASFVYNFAYSVSGGEKAQTLAVINASLLPGMKLFGAWGWFIGLGWLIALARVWRNRSTLQAAPWALLAAFAFPIEVIFSSISGRQFTHYFICWVPVTMLLTAITIDFFLEDLIRLDLASKLKQIKAPLLLLTSIAALLFCYFNPICRTARSSAAAILLPNRDNEFRSVLAKRVAELSDPGDRVLVFAGQAGINVMAERDSIDAALFYPAINNSPIGLSVQAEYFETLKAQMPRLILDGHQLYPQQLPAIDPEERAKQDFQVDFSANLPEVLAWINEHYTLVQGLEDYLIFRLR